MPRKALLPLNWGYSASLECGSILKLTPLDDDDDEDSAKNMRMDSVRSHTAHRIKYNLDVGRKGSVVLKKIRYTAVRSVPP